MFLIQFLTGFHIMSKSKVFEIPQWALESIENTLRIQQNINHDEDIKNGMRNNETCQDRNIKECLNIVRKLLSGKELTGMERLEKCEPGA